MPIRHATQTAKPNNPAKDVSATAWNADHTGSGLPSQWTDGGHGNVTFAADATYSPINVPLNADVFNHPPIIGVSGGTGVDGASVIVKAGDGNGQPGYGVAYLELTGNSANGAAGGAGILGGNGAPTGGAGGAANFQAGDGVLAAGGSVRGQGGDSDTGFQGGNIDLAGGRGNGGLTVGSFVNVSGGLPSGSFLSSPTGAGEVTLGNGGAYARAGEMFALHGYTAAPADGNLNPSEVSLWFDPTPGAAKLKIKAKDSNGTVVTGTVNLT